MNAAVWKWNGSNWSVVGNAFIADSVMAYSILLDGSNLYVGGWASMSPMSAGVWTYQ